MENLIIVILLVAFCAIIASVIIAGIYLAKYYRKLNDTLEECDFVQVVSPYKEIVCDKYSIVCIELNDSDYSFTIYFDNNCCIKMKYDCEEERDKNYYTFLDILM